MFLYKLITNSLLVVCFTAFLQLSPSTGIANEVYAQEIDQVLTKAERRSLEKAQKKEAKLKAKEEKKARKAAEKARKSEAKRLAKIRKAEEKARKKAEEAQLKREAAALAAKSRIQALKDNMPPFSGPKKVVAVSRFENLASFASQGQMSMGGGLTDQLTDALIASGGFVVLERSTVSDVIGEQNFAASGRVKQSQSARTGKLTAAQVLIKGTITEFDTDQSGGDGGISFGGISFSSSKASAHIGLVIRLIDTTTSEIIASVRSEGKAEASSSGLGFTNKDVDVNTSSSVRTPIDKAAQIAIDRAVIRIAHQLKDMSYQGRVVKVTQRSLYISASKRDGTLVGDEFTVLSVGEEITDPYTGELLGRDTAEIGTVIVTNVKDRYAVTQISGRLKGKPKAGDFVTFHQRRISDGQ